MLTEFLLTPDSISDTDGRSGTEVIRELQSCLFPFAAAPSALVCRLGDDRWTRAVSSRIARLQDSNHRQFAQSLFMQIMDQLSVPRPDSNGDPHQESDWVEAGIRSAALVPFEKIIVSGQTIPPDELGTELRHFTSPRFWSNYQNPRLVGRERDQQKKALRAICTHADWLLIRLPQIRGGSDDEIVTVKQIIELACRLPEGFGVSDIDLHLRMMPRIEQDRLLNGVRGELNRFAQRGIKISVSLWPENHFVNRELLAGSYTKTSEGIAVRKALWYVTMTHVSVGSRDANSTGEAGNTWSLFDRTQAHRRLTEIDQETPLHSETI